MQAKQVSSVWREHLNSKCVQFWKQESRENRICRECRECRESFMCVCDVCEVELDNLS